MKFWDCLVFLAGMVVFTAIYWKRLCFDDGTHDVRWFVAWAAKGVLLPLLAWVWLNSGHPPAMPPVVRMASAVAPGTFVVPQLSPVNPGWYATFLERAHYVAVQTTPALFVIGSYWAALTLGWLALVRAWNSNDREGYLVSCVFWGFVLSPIVALVIYSSGLVGIGLALLVWIWPLAHLAMELQPPKTTPLYSRAVASMKFGKYRDAEMAILGELEKSETDFDGWMMLADLYARRFHDLGEAERTVCNLCDDPATSVSQAAIALNKLADWQLELRSDPDRARWALTELRRRMPGTHLARMAELRISQLPGSREELKEKHQPKTIHLPALSEQLDEARDPDAPPVNRREAHARADKCVEKLKLDPNDVAVREQLAGILADQLGAIDQGIEQLELLMEMPEQPAEKMAAWLAQLAAWRLRQEDREAAKRLLEQLVREHPHSVHAFAAQRRLTLLDMDARASKPADGATIAADGTG